MGEYMGILVLAAKQESCSDSLLRPALQPLLLLRLIPSMDPMAMEDMAVDTVWAMLDMEDTMAPCCPCCCWWCCYPWLWTTSDCCTQCPLWLCCFWNLCCWLCRCYPHCQ